MTNTINEHNEMQEITCCGGNDSSGSCCSADSSGCACGSEHDHEHHDHDHDHAHMVTFENEDGTTEEYPIVDEFEVEGQVYILVMNGDETVTPLRVEGEDGELVFLAEDEFQKVSEAYAALADSEELQ